LKDSAAPAISTCFFHPDDVLVPNMSDRNRRAKGIHFNRSSADVLKNGWLTKKYLCTDRSTAVFIKDD